VVFCGVLQFRSFFGCMLDHQDYYQPFLEAFHVDVDKSQEAIEQGKERDGQQQQQQDQQHQQNQQQQQQQQPEESGQQQQQQQPQSTQRGRSS
jgi:hypothetical protein